MICLLEKCGHFRKQLIHDDFWQGIDLSRMACGKIDHARLIAANDAYAGTYNARRDNLGGFWKDVFGYKHGIAVVNAFFENVSRHNMEGRVLRDGERLLSFAAITDETPAEVAAAGHDRCMVPIKPENIDAWLNPDPANLAAQMAILDDRSTPYSENRMAA